VINPLKFVALRVKKKKSSRKQSEANKTKSTRHVNTCICKYTQNVYVCVSKYTRPLSDLKKTRRGKKGNLKRPAPIINSIGSLSPTPPRFDPPPTLTPLTFLQYSHIIKYLKRERERERETGGRGRKREREKRKIGGKGEGRKQKRMRGKIKGRKRERGGKGR